jgi:Uncharacterized protein conserved in bacteria (DUF2064)
MGNRRILQALRLLDTADVVLGPCADGGYYLASARRLIPQMFQQIPWGRVKVLDTTLRAVRKARASIASCRVTSTSTARRTSTERRRSCAETRIGRLKLRSG